MELTQIADGMQMTPKSIRDISPVNDSACTSQVWQMNLPEKRMFLSENLNQQAPIPYATYKDALDKSTYYYFANQDTIIRNQYLDSQNVYLQQGIDQLNTHVLLALQARDNAYAQLRSQTKLVNGAFHTQTQLLDQLFNKIQKIDPPKMENGASETKALVAQELPQPTSHSYADSPSECDSEKTGINALKEFLEQFQMRNDCLGRAPPEMTEIDTTTGECSISVTTMKALVASFYDVVNKQEEVIENWKMAQLRSEELGKKCEDWEVRYKTLELAHSTIVSQFDEYKRQLRFAETPWDFNHQIMEYDPLEFQGMDRDISDSFFNGPHTC